MKKNIHSVDKWLRIMIAFLVVVLSMTSVITGTTAIVLLSIGGILLLTALINFCPIYSILGISTYQSKK